MGESCRLAREMVVSGITAAVPDGPPDRHTVWSSHAEVVDTDRDGQHHIVQGIVDGGPHTGTLYGPCVGDCGARHVLAIHPNGCSMSNTSGTDELKKTPSANFENKGE